MKLLIAVLLAVLYSAPGEAGTVVQNMRLTRLSDAEMDNLRGGFSTAAGLEIAVGLDLSSAIAPINSGMAANAVSGQPNLVASATLSRVNSDSHLVANVQYGAAGAQTVLQNGLNNVSVDQMTRVNIDVGNLARVQSQWLSLNQMIGNQASALPR